MGRFGWVGCHQAQGFGHENLCLLVSCAGWFLLGTLASYSPLRRGHIARVLHAKRPLAGKGSVAASLAVLPLVVHDLPPTWIGNALVQVAIPSHADEYEIAATRRALHVRREQVKPHGKLWHRFIPSPPPAYTPGSISDNTSQCTPWECGPTPDSSRTSSSDGDSWRTAGIRSALASGVPLRQLAAGTLNPGRRHT